MSRGRDKRKGGPKGERLLNKEGGGSKGRSSIPTAFRLQSTTYFLTYKGVSDSGARLAKEALADYLLRHNPHDRKVRPTKYLICEQMYDDGTPHFHAILIYPRRKGVLRPDYYDYQGVHPNIQTMRNMKAALQYVHKQDPHPCTNMDLSRQRRVARAKDSSSLYELLEQQMLRDPFNFDLDDYCHRHGIFKQIYKANYAKAITLIKRAQPAAARALLATSRPGLEPITQGLIGMCLNGEELAQFYAHPCYQRIVDHINEVHRWPNRDPGTMAPLKTRHLLITGPADVGKTSLIYHRANSVDPYPGLAHYLSTYYLAVGQRYYPPYRSFDYRLVNWQQFTIVSDMFPKSGYARLLNYLDGSVSALPQKGRPPVERQDNPKHILTSNRTLQEHVLRTFRSDQARAKALDNLPARVQCVVVPPGRSLHFLRKLFRPRASSYKSFPSPATQ